MGHLFRTLATHRNRFGILVDIAKRNRFGFSCEAFRVDFQFILMLALPRRYSYIEIHQEYVKKVFISSNRKQQSKSVLAAQILVYIYIFWRGGRESYIVHIEAKYAFSIHFLLNFFLVVLLILNKNRKISLFLLLAKCIQFLFVYCVYVVAFHFTECPKSFLSNIFFVQISTYRFIRLTVIAIVCWLFLFSVR